MNNSKDRILIIGVGGAGRNAVKNMYDENLGNASFITFGDYDGDDECEDIPHYNLIEMNGDDYTDARTPEEWKKYTENVEDGIKEIIENHFKEDFKDK